MSDRSSYARKAAVAAMSRWADAYLADRFTDLGWQGSLLGDLIDYMGAAPRGGPDDSNMAQAIEVDRLRRTGLGEAMITQALLSRSETLNSQATRAMRHHYTKGGTKRQQAAALKIDYDVYKAMITLAELWLGNELLKLEKKAA